MNYQNWSKRKFWAVIIGVFILGFIFAPKNTVKEVPVEKIVTKEVPASCDYSNWKTLKGIDDEGFGLSVESMTLCSQGFNAISEFDTNKLIQITTEMKALTSKINDMGTRRQTILKILGY